MGRLSPELQGLVGVQMALESAGVPEGMGEAWEETRPGRGAQEMQEGAEVRREPCWRGPQELPGLEEGLGRAVGDPGGACGARKGALRMGGCMGVVAELGWSGRVVEVKRGAHLEGSAEARPKALRLEVLNAEAGLRKGVQLERWEGLDSSTCVFFKPEEMRAVCVRMETVQ